MRESIMFAISLIGLLLLGAAVACMVAGAAGGVVAPSSRQPDPDPTATPVECHALCNGSVYSWSPTLCECWPTDGRECRS